MCPSAATYTMSGFVGCTTMRVMTCVSFSPLNVQLSPPSIDLKIPPPGEIELREFPSPVPSQTWFGSEGEMPMSPVEATRSPFHTRSKVVPLLVVFHTPPAAADT